MVTPKRQQTLWLHDLCLEKLNFHFFSDVVIENGGTYEPYVYNEDLYTGNDGLYTNNDEDLYTNVYTNTGDVYNNDNAQLYYFNAENEGRYSYPYKKVTWCVSVCLCAP